MKIDIIQLNFIDAKLRRLLTWLEKETGFEFTGTSLYRMKDDGVHGTLPVRGTDLRCRNLGIGRAIEKFINDSWQYDAKRKFMNCAKLHGEGASLHIHVQVHENTLKRGRE